MPSSVEAKENRRQADNQRHKRYREEAKSKGLCILCHKRPAVAGKVNCVECRAYLKTYDDQRKLDALDAYGGRFCSCCGETNIKFLTIDHINNDGAEHRRSNKNRGGNSFYRWLKTHDYPPGYQVLCWNCNCGRACNGGICPHEEQRRALLASLPKLVHY